MLQENTRSPFEGLGLTPATARILEGLGYHSPTPIQEQAIPGLLEGRDLLGQAQTGTGKTAAFALPTLEAIEIDNKNLQALVLTPTRELAMQVSEAFARYAVDRNISILPIYGGQGMRQQLLSLKKGAQIVVGTPGRVIDHIRRKTLNLSQLKVLVLDEADEMLKMGFVEDIELILSKAPYEKQTALFSATMPQVIRKIAKKHLRNELEIKIKSKTSTVENTDQKYWVIEGINKFDALVRMLEVEESDATIIFVRTKTGSIELSDKLEARGYSCAAMNGDLNQALRERTINRLKKGDLDIIVATDVAARGLDVDRISHVINYDAPFNSEVYIHRVGRTGRAGRKGTAILFVSKRDRKMLRIIEKATKQRIQRFDLPSREAITAKRAERFKTTVSKLLDKEDLEFYAKLVDQVVCANGVSLRDVAASFCFLAQKDSPLILKESKPSGKGTRVTRKENERQPRRNRRPRKAEAGMRRYRIDVGRIHGVRPGSIVATIADKSGIPGKYIGKIRLHDDYSTVDLPDGMTNKTLHDLKRAYVNNRRLGLRVE